MNGFSAIATQYGDGDVDTNRSQNEDFQSIIDRRYSRRQTLFGGVGAISAAALSATLVGCGGNEDDPSAPNAEASVGTLGGQG